MHLEWSLKELYPSMESSEFKADWEKTATLVEDLKAWTAKLPQATEPSKTIEAFIASISDLQLTASRAATYLMLILSTNAGDAQAAKLLDRIYVVLSDVAHADVAFAMWLKKIGNVAELAEQSSIIKEHLFFINELKEKSRYMLSEAEETVIAKYKVTGSTAWSNLQDMVSSKLLVDINIDGEDKQLPLAAVRNMAYEADGALRKKAYEAELLAYEKIKESSAAALNGIKGQVITEVSLRGYASALDMTLQRSRMDEKTLTAMLTAMKESLPFFVKFFQAKAKLLGYEGGLYFYDLFAPVGEVDMTFTYEEAMQYVIDNFAKFSQGMGEFAKRARDNEWIDVLPKEGKRGGAFCAPITDIKESRILTNFTGSFSDMLTLAHELGHGYHNECMKDEAVLNTESPMQLAETASTFAETLVIKAALKTATKEEALVILENQITSAAQVIADILSRYIFETNVFEKRAEGYVSCDELKEIMLAAQKEAYGEGLNHEVLHPYMWVCKSHYYSAEVNFYNFPYAFGQLFATGLYAQYEKEGADFVEGYNKLLSSTGKMDCASVAKMADVDITTVDFWRSSLLVIKEDIEQFAALVQERK